MTIGVTVDCVVFTRDLSHILLVKRKYDPFQGQWALPGGFLEEEDGSLLEGAIRELKEETGLALSRMHQVIAFGNPHRDPRNYMVTVAFLGLVDAPTPIEGQDDAESAEWVALPDDQTHMGLAFDHDFIVDLARIKALT